MALRRGGGELGLGLSSRREDAEEEGGSGGRRGCKGRGSGGREAVIRAWAAVSEEGGRGASMSGFGPPGGMGWLARLGNEGRGEGDR